MRADLLDVIAVVSNPIRWESRIRLAKDFIEHMVESGVRLTVVDCAHGDRPHLLGSGTGYRHIPVRARTLAWSKESLVNIGLQRLPDDWKYAAWIDADVVFRKKHWALETVHALQQYHVVQPWSDCYDLGPDGSHLEHHVSFAKLWATGKPIKQGPSCGPGTVYKFGHPGYAWCMTRQALEWVGGLIDTAALGAADHHQALALIGRVMDTIPRNLNPAYAAPMLIWQQRAMRHINMNIGYVPGTIEHKFHGTKRNRAYVSRWDILHKHNFNPETDLKRNLHGVMELAGNKPYLTRDIDIYHKSRNEDANTSD